MVEISEANPTRKAIVLKGHRPEKQRNIVPDRIISGGKQKYNLGPASEVMDELVFGRDKEVAVAAKESQFPEINPENVIAGLRSMVENAGIEKQRWINKKLLPTDFEQRKFRETRVEQLGNLEAAYKEVAGVLEHGRRPSPLQDESDSILKNKISLVTNDFRQRAEQAATNRLLDNHGVFPKMRKGGKEESDVINGRINQIVNTIYEPLGPRN